jgi:regulator of protease activity HflC (stomatin/prohibitin superfamily)
MAMATPPTTPPRPVPDRKAETVAMAGLILQSVLALLTLAVYLYTGHGKTISMQGAGSILGLVLYSIPGMVIWFVSFLRLRLARLAAEETRDMENLRRSSEMSSSLFEVSQRPSAYTAAGRLSKFERWFVPASTVLMAIGMLSGAAWALQSHSYFHGEVVSPRLAKSAAFLTTFAFAAFVLSQYAIGLSSDPSCRKLRPAGSYLLSTSFFLFLVAVALVLLQAELPLFETVVRWLLPVLLGLLAVEFLASFVLDFFRPRLPGQELRPPYDSRVLGIFTQPGNIWGTLSETLDYQFGFRVSRTWFYAFVSRLALPLVAFQLLLAMALSCVVVVTPDEAVLVERFGKWRTTLAPGLHIKFPWPMERTFRVPSGAVGRTTIGFDESATEHTEEPDAGHADHEDGHAPARHKAKTPDNVVLWVEAHRHGGNYFLVASRETPIQRRANETQENPPVPRPPVRPEGKVPDASPAQGPRPPEEESVPLNVINLSVTVHYEVIDPRTFFYHSADPERTIHSVTNQELVRVTSSVDIDDLMGAPKRSLAQAIGEKVASRVQPLGVRILHLGIPDAHPATEVASAFEAVLAAQEEQKKTIGEAESESREILRRASSQATILRYQAQAYRAERVAAGQAAVQGFSHRLKAYEAGPDIFRLWNYYSVLESAFRGKRIFMVPENAEHQRFLIDLKRPLGADILNIDWKE